MKYLYYDLGEQQEGSWVVAHLRGSAANVILLDPVSFERYRLGQPFRYAGGLCTRTPARVQIPEDGHWYLVIDCGGYSYGVHSERLDIVTPDESSVAPESDTALAGANA